MRDFLPRQLHGARSYDRIAGFFSSSLLEVAGEEIEAMAADTADPIVRVICNSCLGALDVQTARAAKAAMRQEWCASLPSDINDAMKARLGRLYDFLSRGLMTVRVLPDRAFGLIHGKAGVITKQDGSRVCFLGSANESRTAWVNNYEIVWMDDSPESVAWIQEEFDALWSSPMAVDLADAVIQDIQRLTHRVIIPGVDDWISESGDPAEPVVELPIYRRENGLWAHQKYFVKLAFEAHKAGGARYVLADQVGLGKTVQLALSAKLMALHGDMPVLILVPKPLVQQWVDELWDLLEMPCAYWNGRQWIDEHGITYPDRGLDGLRSCPRRVGIMSTGLITSGSDASKVLQELQYECVILDEAHRARRRNLGPTHRGDTADPNNLLRFLQSVAPKTRSLLLGTATPVQLDPIEAWDLLEAINRGRETVLGTVYSEWRKHPWAGLDYVLGRTDPPEQLSERWEWMRDPLAPASEGKDFELLRRGLKVGPETNWARPEDMAKLRGPDVQRLKKLAEVFFDQHNPFIRQIVRRTREFLEQTIDPQTNEPYLQPVVVKLFGEDDSESIVLPPFLRDAYSAAERFCDLLGHRPGLSSGFMRTILLRRVGSTIESGRLTALKMLGQKLESSEEDDDADDAVQQGQSSLYPLTDVERAELNTFLRILDENTDEDPKLRDVRRILFDGVDRTEPWIERGCIVFSQFYDSVFWLAAKLSERLRDEDIGIYANATQSGVMTNGIFARLRREDLKARVKTGELRLVIGTDAASEGLNLQRLGTLINLDLPWNPTRLEQRKGRIQRIGQLRDEVLVYNMRYKDSVEDRVHDLLSRRLESIKSMFGQIPDTLEDVWVSAALNDIEKAKEIIDAVPERHPFEMRYDRIEPVDWETCSRVLDRASQIEMLRRGW